jgi:TrmH family RNA methyltransferase
VFKPLSNCTRQYIASLHKKKFRRQYGSFMAEGYKICSELLESAFRTHFIVINKDSTPEIIELASLYSQKGIEVFSTNEKIFSSISDSHTPQGILAVADIPSVSFQADSPFIALENASDPGNLGTIIRSADWFGFRNVILSHNSADPFSPKVVRSTMGSFLRTNIIQVASLSDFIKSELVGYEVFAAVLDSRNELHSIVPQKKFGLIFGSESHGLTDEALSASTKGFTIGGGEKADSLNLAVSAAISMYHFAKYTTDSTNLFKI